MAPHPPAVRGGIQSFRADYFLPTSPRRQLPAAHVERCRDGRAGRAKRRRRSDTSPPRDILGSRHTNYKASNRRPIIRITFCETEDDEQMGARPEAPHQRSPNYPLSQRNHRATTPAAPVLGCVGASPPEESPVPPGAHASSPAPAPPRCPAREPGAHREGVLDPESSDEPSCTVERCPFLANVLAVVSPPKSADQARLGG